MLPTGLSFAPVSCVNRETGATTSYQFVAGFTGVVQSPEDLSLRPAVGWAMTDAARIDKLIARLRNEQEVNPPEPGDTETLLRKFEGNLPADLWRFYAETGGASLNCKNSDEGNIYCRIMPASQIKFAIDSVERELEHLQNQGLITPNEYDARRRSLRSYSELRIFAESNERERKHFYVFGRDPEFDGMGMRESRGQIFRWTGEPTSEAFEPIAHTFSEWLETMLDRTKASKLT
jgi:hypothetical protein